MGRKFKDRYAEHNATLVALLLPIGALMLKGGLGIGDLIRAAKQAYVRAAIEYVAPAGVRVNASRLSVVTGLTRKEVAAIVNEIRGTPTIRPSEVNEQRAQRVLRGWRLDPRFCDAKGEPAKLPLRGDRRSFSALVKVYGGDVTPNSVLKELERMKAVTLNRSRVLRLRPVRVSATSIDHMTDLTRLFPDFANTVSPHSEPNGRPRFFGFRDSVVNSPDQAARFQRIFSNRAAVLLQGVEQWIASQTKSQGVGSAIRAATCRVGIGVYLVQGNSKPPPIAAQDRSRSVGRLIQPLGTNQRG